MNLYLPLRFAGLLLPALAAGGAPREVIVYSFVTTAGRTIAPPEPERLWRCRIGSAGYHEWGGVRAGEKPAPLSQIDPLVRSALRVNSFAPLRAGEVADLVILFHWGCMRPHREGRKPETFDQILNQVDVLDLVGGRVLTETNDGALRTAILDAAAEERYFLIVSAFEPTTYSNRTRTLLWRTQISIPIPGLTQERAFPILASAGAALFGQQTPIPLFVAVEIERASPADQAKRGLPDLQ